MQSNAEYVADNDVLDNTPVTAKGHNDVFDGSSVAKKFVPETVPDTVPALSAPVPSKSAFHVPENELPLAKTFI